MKVKQVIVLRKDLKMRKGKMVAQGAHASLAVILEMADKKDGKIQIDLKDEALATWLSGSFAKICVSVDSEDELLDVYEAAQKAAVPAALIKDSGRTEFGGVPTYTAVAVGPAEVQAVDAITGNLSLL